MPAPSQRPIPIRHYTKRLPLRGRRTVGGGAEAARELPIGRQRVASPSPLAVRLAAGVRSANRALFAFAQAHLAPFH